MPHHAASDLYNTEVDQVVEHFNCLKKFTAITEVDFGGNDTLVEDGVKSTGKSEHTSAVCAATAGSLPTAPELENDILSNPRVLPTPAPRLGERGKRQKKMPNEDMCGLE